MSTWVALKDWIEIKVSGPETMEYLNGIITKDLEKIEVNTLVRAAFLTPHAKVRSVFWVKQVDKSIYFYCPGHMKQALIEDLLKYKLSMDVKLEDITEETPNLYLVSTGEEKIPGLSNNNFGYTLKNLEDKPDGEEISYEQFTDLLIKEGVTPTEVMTGENPYELGIDDVITLEKGCFLGQEPISRMYHRGNPRKYVYHIELTPGTQEKQITQNVDEVGQILIQSGDKGLAYIRRTVDNLENLCVDNSKILVLERVGSYPGNDRN